jgi:hypothetical protein
MNISSRQFEFQVKGIASLWESSLALTKAVGAKAAHGCTSR